MQSDLFVQGIENPAGGDTGEWGPLQYTNYHISLCKVLRFIFMSHKKLFTDSRFGFRQRPYVAHTAKALSLSLLKEFTTIWHKEVSITASHPFRGMTAGNPDLYTLFLYTHSIVERWREALLWSWAVGKHGGLEDEWTEDIKARAWQDLGGKPGESALEVFMKPRLSANPRVVDWTLREAGYIPSGKTTYEFGPHAVPFR